MIAADNGHTNAVELLVLMGAAVNAQDNYGLSRHAPLQRTALALAGCGMRRPVPKRRRAAGGRRCITQPGRVTRTRYAR